VEKKTPGVMTPAENARAVKEKALALGFSSCGIADLSPVSHEKEFNSWLENGFAATMAYMQRQKKKRLEPSRIVPGATSAIVLTRNYFVADKETAPGSGKVAKYARREDYHDSLAKPLKELVEFCCALGAEEAKTRSYVDAGPVPERELAQRAGLGWIGKNTMLIDPKRGSFFFLASVLTDLSLERDQPFQFDRCGECRQCLDCCPTDAFVGPRVLDANACISYLTIEYRGAFDAAKNDKLNDWIFGCDICQDVCPWNGKFAQPMDDELLGYRADLDWLDPEELMHISDEEFEIRFGSTPLERPGPSGMRRNALALLAKEGNNGE